MQNGQKSTCIYVCVCVCVTDLFDKLIAGSSGMSSSSSLLSAAVPRFARAGSRLASDASADSPGDSADAATLPAVAALAGAGSALGSGAFAGFAPPALRAADATAFMSCWQLAEAEMGCCSEGTGVGLRQDAARSASTSAGLLPPGLALGL